MRAQRNQKSNNVYLSLNNIGGAHDNTILEVSQDREIDNSLNNCNKLYLSQ